MEREAMSVYWVRYNEFGGITESISDEQFQRVLEPSEGRFSTARWTADYSVDGAVATVTPPWSGDVRKYVRKETVPAL